MQKKVLIKHILDKELKMFVTVRADQPAACQSDADGFQAFRSSQVEAWSEGTLESYLHDLEKAEADGLNLMTLKYARMENQILPLHENPQVIQMIGEMVSIQLGWQNEIMRKYPALMAHGRPIEDLNKTSAMASFKNYLSCELETYSQMTLTHLFRDIMACHSKCQNMSEKIYATMV
ncbi:MAG: DUF4125 family protein, partial [Desulfosarcina sp.]|nr:DUF4125 family protein [Desulfobacterales bacterium]